MSDGVEKNVSKLKESEVEDDSNSGTLTKKVYLILDFRKDRKINFKKFASFDFRFGKN